MFSFSHWPIFINEDTLNTSIYSISITATIITIRLFMYFDSMHPDQMQDKIFVSWWQVIRIAQSLWRISLRCKCTVRHLFSVQLNLLLLKWRLQKWSQNMIRRKYSYRSFLWLQVECRPLLESFHLRVIYVKTSITRDTYASTGWHTWREGKNQGVRYTWLYKMKWEGFSLSQGVIPADKI